MADPTPQVHEIDISRHAKAFNFATTANYGVAYCCLVMAGIVVVLYVIAPLIAPSLFEEIQTEPLFVDILFALLFAFCAFAVFRDIGKIDDADFHQLSRLYPVSIVASSLIVALTSLEWEIEIKALVLFSCASAVAGLVFVRRLRRSPLPAIHMSVADLAAKHRGDEIARMSKSISSIKIKKRNTPLAAVLILVGLLGIVWHVMDRTSLLFIIWMDFMWGEWMGEIEELRYASPEELARPFEERYPLSYWLGKFMILSAFIAPFAGIAGFGLLLRARQHLQIDADAMLSVDSRDPVVFLRAFEDEERPDYRQSQTALIDFSLEARLTEHVRYLGPFVAVGCPTDRVPLLGASRAKLPDSEWQAHVIEWISKASVIIMYAGKTRWVNWELGNVIAKERTESMILIIPELKRERGLLNKRAQWRVGRRERQAYTRKRQEDIALRIDRIKQVFESTKWRSALAEIREMQGIRVLLFEEDGSVAVIRSRSGSRGAYHLAALVGLYLVRNRPQWQYAKGWHDSVFV